VAMTRPVLLDTCAAIWLMNGDPMSADSRASITAAQGANLGVYVSPMTAWEIATLVCKNRLRLSLSPGAWFDSLLGFAGVRLAPMPPRVLIASASLPGVPPKDPVDRIIAATGRAFGYALITRDGELTRYARAGHIELVEC
jgi:PIN domain nuclease of toxin-antitoxin system